MPRAISDRSAENTAESSKETHLTSQPDALGVATRLAAQRLRDAGIILEPLLRGAGLSVGQIDQQNERIGVASQIKFLELAAGKLKDPLLGFRLARDVDLRQMGLLYYAAASSPTLGVALDRAQRYSSIVNAGVALKCLVAGNFTIAVRYTGIARHYDRQQMEFLMTVLIRVCRVLADRHLVPTAIRLVHRSAAEASELEKFLACQIEYGADIDEIVFPREAAQLHLVGADPYLNELLLHYCDEALAYRRSNASSLRVTVENVITPLLPHGKVRLDDVAQKLGMSSRTLLRRLTAEGLSFAEILNQLRSDLATRYLGESTLSISQIAWLVGYQGVSAFSHGCKRWTGMNPKVMRDKLLASP
jgi:AraC-like DNA-binding protein